MRCIRLPDGQVHHTIHSLPWPAAYLIGDSIRRMLRQWRSARRTATESSGGADSQPGERLP